MLRTILVFAPLTALFAGHALAADKKAEGDMRWGLNYCKKIITAMERVEGKDLSPQRINDLLNDWAPHHEKFVDYMEKAKAKDASVVDSTTIFDRKTETTFAQYYQRCLELDGKMQAMRDQAEGKKAERAEAKANEAKQQQTAETHRLALEAAKDAIWGRCSSFKGWAGSSSIDEQIAAYQAAKNKALELLPTIVEDSYTVELTTESGKPGVETTKTFGEWFAYCDGMMPKHAAAVRKNEAATAAAAEADAAKRKAMNDKIRAEQKKKFNALVAAATGDRKRILQSKGFLPWWPRGVDLKTAPVWKWEINITHEPVRCESYRFEGNKLAKHSTVLGACP